MKEIATVTRYSQNIFKGRNFIVTIALYCDQIYNVITITQIIINSNVITEH